MFRSTALSLSLYVMSIVMVYLVSLLYLSMNPVAESHETNVQTLFNQVFGHYSYLRPQEGLLSLVQ